MDVPCCVVVPCRRQSSARIFIDKASEDKPPRPRGHLDEIGRK
ncbi:hypothetical protein GEV33_011669 [Tenebrio molitor]|uniref:Uncharacterized protein n=1 Tax=Tenebrio molitor TaxID=7067 RepID=A0A8J6HAU0_TENMO|nr:hypothetical protein GEV33_011669 [Tenebrio molitor]